MNQFLQVVITILLVISIALSTFSIMRETIRLNKQFIIQMKMSEAQASMTNPLKFDEIKKIIEDIIINQCIMEISNNGYGEKTDEEMSLIITDIILNISTLTEQSLSKELIRQWEKFSTEEYRTRFIIFTVRAALMSQLNRMAVNRMNTQPNSNQDKKMTYVST